MAGSVWSKALPAPGEERDDFGQWLVAKSFPLLAPVCLLGLVVVLCMLLIVDPVLHGVGVWGANQQHSYLVLWHVCATGHFMGFLLAARGTTSHARRCAILVAFFAASAVLFSWFASVVSQRCHIGTA